MTEDPAFVWNANDGRNRPVERTDDSPLGVDRRRSRAPRSPERRAATPDPTPDAVLVPVDEWSRILRQLGNLHEAGQQLAEARERAAKAETESTFLKERLREAREHADRLQTAIDSEPEPEPEPLPGFGEWFVRRWLEKRKATS